MNPTLPSLLDEQLTAALAERARPTPDDRDLARGIVEAARSTPQATSLRWIPWPDRRTALLLAAGLAMLALIAGTVAGGVLRQSGPLPHIHNGPILSSGADGLMLVDPLSGDVLEADGLALGSGVHDAAWSPDGQRLALAGANGIMIQSSAGTSIPIASCDETCGVDWSPDGAWLAVTRPGGVDLVTPDGRQRRTIVEGVSMSAWARGPAFSPDGRRIAFITDDQATGSSLITVDVAEDTTDTLATEIPDTIGFVDPTWSADGTSIVYLGSDAWKGESIGRTRGRPLVSGETPGWTLQLKRVPVGGGTPEIVADIGSCYCLGFTPGLGRSPDGTKLALTTIVGPDGDPVGPGGIGGLYIIDPDGTGMRLLRAGVEGTPAWRPVP